MNRSLTGSPNSPPLEGWQAKPDGFPQFPSSGGVAGEA